MADYNIKGWRPEPPDHRDFVLAAHLPSILTAPIPSAASLRSILSPVQNQGGFGSCTAFASLGAIEAVARKVGISYPLGSRMAQYYWTRAMEGWQGQDSGGYIRDAVKVLVGSGMAASSLWPYTQPNLFAQPPSAVVADASQRQALKYISVPNDGFSVKQVIASGFPVIIGFSVPENFMSVQVAQTGMVPMPSGSIVGGHAVLLTGYDDATSLLEFQNSWSTDWGKQGFGYMPYAFLQQLGADFWMISEVEGAPVPPTPTPPPMPNGTWCPFAQRRDGPTTKIGYPAPLGVTAPKRGEIKHSAEGDFAGAMSVLDGTVQSSWHFTVAYDRIYQHYPVEVNAWHGNDTDDDQAVRANIDLVGIEHLGRAGEALTPFQLEATVKLTKWLAEVCGQAAFSRWPTQQGWVLAEHKELGNTPTACPSNRIPWGVVMEALKPPAPPEPPPPPARVWMWGDEEAGLERRGNQLFSWNKWVEVDAVGDYEGLFPGAHYHNYGGEWVKVLP